MASSRAGEHRVFALIIGAGFGGIGMAIRLRQAGIDDFVVLEKGGGVGGVWRDNIYPDAECDVPSYLYSFSFERRYPWPRLYSGQPDILAYLKHCVAKFEVGSHIRVNCEVAQASFDEATGLWRVGTTDGEDYFCRLLITGTGQLNRPLTPDIEGLAGFAGTVFHSARWNSDYDLRGRAVATIGSGGSAVQFIPRVAQLARQLTVFQRSAPYVIPKITPAIGRWFQALLDLFPGLYSVARNAIYCFYEWAAPSFGKWGLLTLLKISCRLHLAFFVKDPVLRRKLTPDYEFGCKRVLFSNQFYQAILRPNVTVETDEIRRIHPDGIETKAGRRYPVDAIILGTGFRASEFLAPIEIIGRGGDSLRQRWGRGAEAYLGLTVSGFPNLFLLYGPNTNLGHNSIIFMLESQFRYILQAARRLRAEPGLCMDLRASVGQSYNADLETRLGRSLWMGCRNWFRNEHGKIVNNWPGLSFLYRRRTKSLRAEDYDWSKPAPSTADAKLPV